MYIYEFSTRSGGPESHEKLLHNNSFERRKHVDAFTKEERPGMRKCSEDNAEHYCVAQDWFDGFF